MLCNKNKLWREGKVKYRQCLRGITGWVFMQNRFKIQFGFGLVMFFSYDGGNTHANIEALIKCSSSSSSCHLTHLSLCFQTKVKKHKHHNPFMPRTAVKVCSYCVIYFSHTSIYYLIFIFLNPLFKLYSHWCCSFYYN